MYLCALAESFLGEQRRKCFALAIFFLSFFVLLRQMVTKGGGGKAILAESLEIGRERLVYNFSILFCYLASKFALQ